MIPASYPLVGPSLRLRDAGGYEPTLSPSIEFAGALISQQLRHLASCDDGGGSIDGIQTYWGVSTANEWTFTNSGRPELFLDSGIKQTRIPGEIQGVAVSNITLYD